ncbi:MAG: hypothetical protein WAO07_14890 [Desulfobacterales bacterium]
MSNFVRVKVLTSAAAGCQACRLKVLTPFNQISYLSVIIIHFVSASPARFLQIFPATGGTRRRLRADALHFIGVFHQMVARDDVDNPAKI